MKVKFLSKILEKISHLKRLVLVLVVLLALMVVGLSVFAGRDYFKLKLFEPKIKANQVWSKLYADAREGDKLLRENKDNYEHYLAAGLNWKSLGDQTGEAIFYKKSLEVYEQAIRKFGTKAYVAHLNAANTARYLKDFKLANKYYGLAIDMNPGEAGTYMAKAELMRYELKSSHEEIVTFYDNSLKVLIGGEYIRLVTDYAAYLRGTEHFEEAIKVYKLLLLIFPNHGPYLDLIKTLEEQLREGQTDGT